MNIIDTRDLYKRQCELQEELETLQDDIDTAIAEVSEEQAKGTGYDPELATAAEDAEAALSDWQSEYQEELNDLNTLESEVGREWMHGETLIPADDFIEYVRDLAEDLHGTAIRDAAWPFDHIDWEAAADDLESDYSSCEYQGTTYLFRS